ncbi:regulatory solute carrier protein family 1 member 1 [Ctenodactylus gundi]
MLVGEKDGHLENQDLGHGTGLQQHLEPGSEQHEVQQSAPRDQGHLCDMMGLRLPAESQQDQERRLDLKAALTGDRLWQNADLPSTETDFLPSGCFGCSNPEVLMEVDVAAQSPAAVHTLAGRQGVGVRSSGAPTLTSDNPLMEVETSKCNPSAESWSNSISTQDLQPPESNVEMSGTNKKYGSKPPSLSLGGICQPSVESTEESCSSVIAALKELHELLVISNKPAPENAPEVICESKITPESYTDVKNLSQRCTQSECLPHSEQCPHVSIHPGRAATVTAERVGPAPVTGAEDGENSSFSGPGGGLSPDKEGVPKSRESITVTSVESSSQLHCTSGVEILPKLVAGEEDKLDQTSEKTESLSSSFILVKELGHSLQDPGTVGPGTREDVCPEAAGPFLELEPSSRHQSSDPPILSPRVFPATDIDRILRAGFTLQEALGALHRVGGNADLALLVLLAKNIVVPT